MLRGSDAVPGPASKLPRIVRGKDEYQDFVAGLGTVAVEVINVRVDDDVDELQPVEVLNFPTAWWGKGQSVRPLLVRRAYQPILKWILERESLPVRGVIITGTPGTGKSCGALYIANELMSREGGLVMYEYKSEVPLLLVGNGAAKYLPEDFGVTESGTYAVADKSVHRALLSVKKLVRVVDPPPGDVDYTTLEPGSCFFVVAASPRRGLLKEARKDVVGAKVERWFMDLWTEEELQLAAAAMRAKGITTLTRLVDGSLKTVPLTPALVSARFATFGGSARPIFALEYDDELAVALSEMAFEEVQDLVLSDPLDRTKSQLHSLLVHRAPKPDNHALSTSDFASDYLARLIIRKFSKDARRRAQGWVKSAQGVVGEYGPLRGALFEWYAHEVLLNGGIFEIAAVGSASAPPHDRAVAGKGTIEVPKLRLLEFNSSLDELTELRLNDYALPASRVYQSLDAVAVVNRQLFDSTAGPGDACFVGFQMTIAKKHGLRAKGLAQALEHARAKLAGFPPSAPKVPMFVVIVTDNRAMSSAQNILTEAGKVYKQAHEAKNMPQFIIYAEVR